MRTRRRIRKGKNNASKVTGREGKKSTIVLFKQNPMEHRTNVPLSFILLHGYDRYYSHRLYVYTSFFICLISLFLATSWRCLQWSSLRSMCVYVCMWCLWMSEVLHASLVTARKVVLIILSWISWISSLTSTQHVHLATVSSWEMLDDLFFLLSLQSWVNTLLSKEKCVKVTCKYTVW